jgi:hypothetical protein
MNIKGQFCTFSNCLNNWKFLISSPKILKSADKIEGDIFIFCATAHN